LGTRCISNCTPSGRKRKPTMPMFELSYTYQALLNFIIQEMKLSVKKLSGKHYSGKR